MAAGRARQVGPPSMPPHLPGRIETATTADRYRRLVLLLFTLLAVAAGILAGVVTIGAEMSPGLVGLVVPQLYLIVAALIFAMAYHVYCVAEGVGLDLPILWAAAVVAPGLNVVALVVLYVNAQAWCRQHGIATGPFGPTHESIADYRRR
jgi:hypothetical protein